MEISEIKDVLNSIISEDLNLKEIIGCIDNIALDDCDIEINRNADKYLTKISIDAITSIEKTRNYLSKLAKSIDELYGKSKQHEFGKELNNYTDQFFKSEDMYKFAVSSANYRIRNLDRSKLFKKQVSTTTNGNKDDAIRNRIRRSYLQQSVDKSNQLVNGMKQVTSEFAQQAEISKKTLDILNEDSETLVRTHGTYQQIDTNANTATRLVGKYNRREMWDTILIAIAFLFFIIVSVYIVIKRLSRKIWCHGDRIDAFSGVSCVLPGYFR